MSSYTVKVIQNDFSVNETPVPDDTNWEEVTNMHSAQLGEELQSMQDEKGTPDRITIVTTITRD